MNNVDLIVGTLLRAGVTHGFGIPSGNVLPLIDAMRRGGLPFVLTAHEGSAGFAADVMGRMTGRPGLGIATLGPGATNLATGVGNAFLDRSPMIAITCNLDTDQLGRRRQMWIDHRALFQPITKASFDLRPGTVEETAMSEPMGPVHLDLPEDVGLAPAVAGTASLDFTAGALDPADDGAIEEAARRLAGAKRPIAVLGASSMRLEDDDLPRRFVERHGIPFVTTTMAKGLIDEVHPLSLGCIERARRQVQRDFLRGADLIVGVGYDTIEVEYEAWIGETPLLQIDIEPVDVDDDVRLAGEVTGDLASSLERLSALSPIGNDWTSETIAAHRTAFQVALRPDVSGFAPHQAIDAVRRVLPADGILTYDVGAHTHQIASQWSAHGPRTCHATNGWSSMGFGLPSAIAAKLARPDLPVVCLLGDGCFQMTCGEVATARRLGLSMPIVVLDDGWLSLIQVKQSRRQFPHYGTTVLPEVGTTPPHYFGVPALEARDAAALEAALTTALAAEGPTVIEAKIDAAHYMDTVFD